MINSSTANRATEGSSATRRPLPDNRPSCVCPGCGARLVADYGLFLDVTCPVCKRIFNPLFGDGMMIGYRSDITEEIKHG